MFGILLVVVRILLYIACMSPKQMWKQSLDLALGAYGARQMPFCISNI